MVTLMEILSQTRTKHVEYLCVIIWVNYNDLTATSLEIIVNKGNHPQMALIHVSELLLFAQIYGMHGH